MKGLVVLVGLLLIPVTVQAQTTWPVNTPFRIQSVVDVANADLFRLYIDGAKIGSDVPQNTVLNSTVTFIVAAPGFTVLGPHTITVEAVGMGGKTMSPTLTVQVVSVTPAPKAPGTPQILPYATPPPANGTPSSPSSP